MVMELQSCGGADSEEVEKSLLRGKQYGRTISLVSVAPTLA